MLSSAAIGSSNVRGVRARNLLEVGPRSGAAPVWLSAVEPDVGSVEEVLADAVGAVEDVVELLAAHEHLG